MADLRARLVAELRELGVDADISAPIERLEAKLRELKVKRASKGGLPEVENR